MSFIKKYGLLIGACALLIIILFIVGIQDLNKPKERFIISYIESFDTVTQIVGYEDKQSDLQEKADVLNEKLIYYHKLYDIYHSYDGINNLYTINKNAGVEPVKVDPEIINLLKFSIELYELTDGQTNIAMGSVLTIWHDYRTHGINNPSDAALPSMDKLQEAAQHMDINKIIIDEEASTVYLDDPEMSLDVGSIGKGYAVQKVAEYAKELGYNNIAISVGGNVATVGSTDGGDDWRFGIQNPFLDDKENPYAARVDITDLCLVTSGDYQRFYTVDDVEYCHIIDPDTLMPADYFKSVSVIIADSGKADALSTALFNMTYEEGLALINSIEGADAMWVFEDGSIKYSEDFEGYVVD